MGLSVTCLGGLVLSVDGTEVLLPQRKQRALVAYLAVTGRRASRGELAGLLWGDVDESRARTSLRTALTAVRRALGEVLVAEGDEVFLDQGRIKPVDAVELGRLVDADRLEAAVALYHGPFLEGLDCDHAVAFEEWSGDIRSRIHQVVLAAYQGIAERHLAEGRLPAAIDALSRSVELEPWDEAALRALMRALGEARRSGAALEAFRKFRRRLADQLGAQPEASTTALAESLASELRGPLALDALVTGPAPPTPIVGRERELETLRLLLTGGSTRLATLTGPGGVGKTRLAHEMMHAVAGTAKATVFVDLSGLATGEEIPLALARSLRVPLLGVREPIEEIAKVLADRGVLVVLDNLEHLLPLGAAMVRGLLDNCPNLRVLATSRARLGLAAEQVVPVRPLRVGPARRPHAGTNDASTGAQAGGPAVELLVNRARTAGVELDTAELDTAAELCRRLDGLPLAIELAASQLRYFTLGEVLASLADSVEPLEDLGIERPARHRTLLDSTRWSYRLLDEPARRLLRYLGVFRGGISLDALSAGIVPGGVTRSSLASLLEHGLLERQGRDAATRLAMMESTRDLASRELIDNDEQLDAARLHCAAHVAIAEQADRGLRGPEQTLFLERLEQEADNMAAALRYAGEHDPAVMLRLANGLAWFWSIRGRLHEGAGWLAEAICRAEGADCGEDGRRALAHGLLNLARLRIRRGQLRDGDDDKEIVDLLDRAEALLSALDEASGLVEVAHLRVVRKMSLAEADAASAGTISTLRRGIDVLEGLGNTWGAARLGVTLSPLVLLEEGAGSMLEVADDSYRRYEAVGDRRGMASVLNAVGVARVLLGDVLEGRQLLRRALEDLLAVGDDLEVINSLHAFGYSFLVAADDSLAGARLLGAGARLSANSGLAYMASLKKEVDRVAGPARKSVGEGPWQQAWAEGWRSGSEVCLPEP